MADPDPPRHLGRRLPLEGAPAEASARYCPWCYRDGDTTCRSQAHTRTSWIQPSDADGLRPLPLDPTCRLVGKPTLQAPPDPLVA